MSEQNGPSNKVLRRSTSDRMLFGVCGGAAQYLGVDANLLRLALAILTVIGGTGVALYVVGVLLIPEEGQEQSIAQELLAKARD